jgi:hypothetical protein
MPIPIDKMLLRLPVFLPSRRIRNGDEFDECLVEIHRLAHADRLPLGKRLKVQDIPSFWRRSKKLHGPAPNRAGRRLRL